MTNTTNFAVGDRVIIQNRGGGWDGVTGTIEKVSDPEPPTTALYWVRYDEPKTTPYGYEGGNWTEKYGYLAKLSGARGEPEVTSPGPKAALTHDTSREYADSARSRLLPEWADDALKAAAAGEEVDVVEFRKAATQALSLAATRAGQSPIRRRFTKEARHLIYWADAIIDNHIAGLPVYEGGPRSPKIAELRNEISTLTQAASDERRRLCEEIDRARRSESIEVERTTALIREKSALEVEVEDLKATVIEAAEQIGRGTRSYDKLKADANKEIDRWKAQVDDLLTGRTNDLKAMQHLYDEINEAHAALEYAFGLLSDGDQRRLAGFRDGFATRVNDEA